MNTVGTICILGDWLHGIPDEGIHNLAQNLMDQWGMTYSVKALRIGADLRVNRLFLSWRLRKILRDIRPDVIIYISPSCAKVTALLRAKVLKIDSPRSRVFVIATQPVGYNRFEEKLVHLLAPDGIFIQSPRSKQELKRIPCPVHFLPSGVDTNRFAPVDEPRKRSLRQKYNVDEGVFVVLHVGHINRNRNVQVLGRLAGLEDVRVMLVGSTSTRHDEDLADQLAHAGVLLIREFIPHVEEIYQLADAYLFPVISEDAAIGVPLSVLEAMACNLPVMTTPFGGLPWMFPGENGVFYFRDDTELPGLIADVRRLQESSTRRMVEPYDWRKVAPHVMEMIQTGNSQ